MSDSYTSGDNSGKTFWHKWVVFSMCFSREFKRRSGCQNNVKAILAALQKASGINSFHTL